MPADLKTCAVCGKPLTGRRKKYCSESCARAAERDRARSLSSQYAHPQPFREITCPDCGRTVTVPIKSIRCPSCQAEADRVNNLDFKRRKRLGKVRSIGSTDLCARCGKPYTVTGGRQRYCPDCAQKAFQDNDRAASRAWNRAAYADPDKRQRRNEKRRRLPLPDAVCPVCGKSFSPSSSRNIYCSPDCRAVAVKQQNARYNADHRQAITDRKRELRAKTLSSLTPEELQARRDRVNAQAREAYAKRKSQKRGI